MDMHSTACLLIAAAALANAVRLAWQRDRCAARTARVSRAPVKARAIHTRKIVISFAN